MHRQVSRPKADSLPCLCHFGGCSWFTTTRGIYAEGAEEAAEGVEGASAEGLPEDGGEKETAAEAERAGEVEGDGGGEGGGEVPEFLPAQVVVAGEPEDGDGEAAGGEVAGEVVQVGAGSVFPGERGVAGDDEEFGE
jgi:hypothetical protein